MRQWVGSFEEPLFYWIWSYMMSRHVYGLQPVMPVGVVGEPNLIASNNWLTR
ncbi:hypothetical protein [Methanobrevibacter sp.]|uniref:hypothetical protein n=1 Tax=Methanobrevibacter sp. TaxID=66852 RepID=UPI003867A33E